MNHCPDCETPGRKVKRVTLENLLRPEHHAVIGDECYYVCATPDCDTVYFNGESRFCKSDLVVRFGLKERAAPRPVCYCFNHTIEEIHDEIERTGQSTVLESIKAEMKGPGCRCEYTNPLGGCCLNTVKAMADEGFRQHGIRTATVGAQSDCCATDDCCAPSAPARSGVFAVGGSVVAAALSSACCWLPLVLLAFGASAAGVAGFFEQLRIPFVAAAAALLGAGFYFQYWRKPQCDDGSCPAPSKRLRVLNLSMLWVATAFVVAMVLFPNYVQHFVVGSGAIVVASTSSEGIMLVVPVEGMTCEGCASILTNSLSKVAGVLGVGVSYPDKRALVTISPEDESVRRRIVDAVMSAGYKTRIEDMREQP